MVGTAANVAVGNPFGKFLLFVAFAILGIMGIVYMVSTTPSQHALERHGEEAVLAHSCMNDGGTIQATLTRPSDGRKATVCQINGVFYVYVEEACGQEVTSMCKNKMSRLDQVLKYLNNRGYQ